MVINPNSSGILYLPMPDWAAGALKNNFAVYVYGTVGYRDIFRKDHWAECCFVVTDNGQKVAQALFHNSCDDLESQ